MLLSSPRKPGSNLEILGGEEAFLECRPPFPPGEAGESAVCGERVWRVYAHIYTHIHPQAGLSCVILSKLHNLSEPPFLNFKMRTVLIVSAT